MKEIPKIKFSQSSGENKILESYLKYVYQGYKLDKVMSFEELKKQAAEQGFTIIK